MNKKQNDYQNVNYTPLFYFWYESAQFFYLYDLEAEKNISGVIVHHQTYSLS